MLWWIFQQYLARLPYCLSNHPLKRDFLNIYLTTFSESVTSKIQNLWGSSFDSKLLKFILDFKSTEKNFKKYFCFLCNWIWIGITQFFLLRTGHFSSVANVLPSSPKILHVNRRDFFQLNFLRSDRSIQYDKGAVIQISTVLGQVYDIASRSVLWNRTL